MEKQSYFYGTGRRKTSVARVKLTTGNGAIIVNGTPYEERFPSLEHQSTIVQPFIATESTEKYNAVVKVEGGKMIEIDTGINNYFGGHQLGLMPCTHGIGVNVVLTGGMEPRVVEMFNDLGIRVITDLEGEVGQVINGYITSPSM